MSNYGSEMIDFNKADMENALGKISHWTGKSSPRFRIGGEGMFPVRIWYSEYGYNLSLNGREWDIIRLYGDGKLKIRKGVRLR